MAQGAAFGDWPTNFATVDARVWRGAAPSQSAALKLEGAGVRTVINLEWEGTDAAVYGGRPVNLVRIRDFEPLPWFAPSLADEHVVRALAAIRRGPPICYVHCRSGQNRTGVVIAAYRILERGDSPDVVIEDFQQYRGWWAWGDAIYLRSLDRRRADLLDRITTAAMGAT